VHLAETGRTCASEMKASSDLIAMSPTVSFGFFTSKLGRPTTDIGGLLAAFQVGRSIMSARRPVNLRSAPQEKHTRKDFIEIAIRIDVHERKKHRLRHRVRHNLCC